MTFRPHPGSTCARRRRTTPQSYGVVVGRGRSPMAFVSRWRFGRRVQSGLSPSISLGDVAADGLPLLWFVRALGIAARPRLYS